LHELYASSFAITAHRVTQAIVDGLWIQQRIDKRLAVAHRQFELLVFLNRPPCSILDTGQYKVGDRPSLERGGMFDERLLLCRYPRLKTLRAGAATGRFRGYVCHGNSPASNVRPMPGHFKSGVRARLFAGAGSATVLSVVKAAPTGLSSPLPVHFLELTGQEKTVSAMRSI